MDLILASTSAYRHRLLARLHLPFRSLPSGVEESRRPGEDAGAMSARLALAKARSIAALYPAALVIGCDQVASIDDTFLGKPGTHEAACAQLRASSGRAVHFHTAVALVGKTRDFDQFHVELFTVYFRQLNDATIENYLAREKPYDCAGSFKCEGLGIALLERMQGNDPTGLEGLPLIAVTALLGQAGIDILGDD